MKSNRYQKNIRIGVDLDNLVLPIDPINNPTLTNAFFSNNLYFNLVEVDEQNKYRPQLASNFWFDRNNNSLFFEFKNSNVTSKDAEFNLRRIIMRGEHYHTDFWSIICEPGSDPINCINRIYVLDDKLVIKYFDSKKADLIVPTLASVDFKIVPAEAFDVLDYIKAKIVDYTKTSSPYALFIDFKGDKPIYKFNLKNKENSQLFHTYELVNLNQIILNDYQSNKSLDSLDMISTTIGISKKIAQVLLEKKWNLFQTHNISLYLLSFSKDAIRKTTVADRFNISKRIFEEILSKNVMYSIVPTNQLFQDFGQGYLSINQKVEIDKLRDTSSRDTDVKLNFYSRVPDRWKSFTEINKDIGIVKYKMVEDKDFRANFKDIFSITNDVSFDLNLSLISYAANVGLLDLTKEQLNEFAEMTDEKEKIKFINEAHFRTLKNCQIYPMWATPYFTAFNGDYTHELSKFNSRTVLWKIH